MMTCRLLRACSWAVIALPAVTASALPLPAPEGYAGAVIRHRFKTAPGKLLALTIDDGPDPHITPMILDSLKSHGAHATFFVLGALASRHPELLQRMVREGHAVGSHTWSHALHPTKEAAARELETTASAIEKAVKFHPTLFRPPGGSLRSWTARLAQQEGYTLVLWTISTADTATRDPEVIARNVIHTPNPGDIVLMHDSATKRPTATALPHILEELGAQGWRFLTIPELMRASAQGKTVTPDHRRTPPATHRPGIH